MITTIYLFFFATLLMFHYSTLNINEGFDGCDNKADTRVISIQNQQDINNIKEQLKDYEQLKEDVKNNKFGIQGINDELFAAGNEITGGLDANEKIPQVNGLE